MLALFKLRTEQSASPCRTPSHRHCDALHVLVHLLLEVDHERLYEVLRDELNMIVTAAVMLGLRGGDTFDRRLGRLEILHEELDGLADFAAAVAAAL